MDSAGGASLGRAEGEIFLDAAGALRGLKSLQGSLQDVDRQSASFGSALRTNLQGMQTQLNQWGASLRSVGTNMTAGITLPVVAGFTAMALGAADLEQSVGATGQLWGDNAAEIIAWAKAADRSMGLTQNQALTSVNNFNAMFKQLDAGTAVVKDMSQEFVGLSADLSAMWGGSTIEASESLTSALRGNYEGLDKYNINLTEAMVSQEAMNVAIADGRDEISEADKLQARYNLILEQTTAAQGQFARETNTTSGRIAILRARIGNLATNIGGLLLPYVNRLADLLSGVVDWLERTDDTTRKWALGIAAAAAAIGPLLVGIGIMLPGLGALVAVITALISPIGLVIAGLAALAVIFHEDIISAVETAVDWFRDFISTSASVRNMIDDLRVAFGAFKDGDFGEAFALIGRAAGQLWIAIQEAVAEIDWSVVGGALLDGLASLAGYVAGFVLDLGSIAVSVGGWLWSQAVDLWGGLVNWAVGLVPAGEPVDLGTVTAAIAGWAFSALQGLWDALTNWAVGGTYGDGTGGATAGKVGQVPLGTVMANIAAWAFSAITDIATAVLDWIGTVTVSIPDLAWNLAMGEPLVTGVTAEIIDQALEDLIGTTVVYAMELTIKLGPPAIEWAVPVSVAVAAALPLALIMGAAIPTTISLAPIIGWGVGGALLSAWTFNQIKDYFESNPIEAVEVLTPITVAMGDTPLDGLANLYDAVYGPVIDEFDRAAEAIRNYSIVVGLPSISWPSWDMSWTDIPFVLDITSGVNAVAIWMRNPFGFVSWRPGLPSISWPSWGMSWEDWPFVSDIKGQIDGFVEWIKDPWPDITVSMPDISWPFGGDDSLPSDQGGDPVTPEAVPEADPNGFMGPDNGIATAFRDIASAAGEAARAIPPVTLAMSGVLGTSGVISAWGTTAQTAFGMASSAGSAMAAIVLPTFASIAASAGANLGAMAGAAIANFSSMASSAGSSLGQMAGNAASNFGSITSTGTSQTAGMRAAVTGAFSGMASQAGSSLGQMAGNALSQFGSMRSNASSAGSQIASAISSGTAQAANAAGSNLGRLAGIVAAAGRDAAANARSAGSAIGEGLASGIDAMYNRVAAAGARLANAAAAAIALAAEVESPSKVTTRLGELIGIGPAIGIEKMIPKVVASVRDMMSSVQGAFAPDALRFATPAMYGGSYGAPIPAAVYASPAMSQPITYHVDNRQFFALQQGEYAELLSKAETGARFAHARTQPTAITQYLGGRR